MTQVDREKLRAGDMDGGLSRGFGARSYRGSRVWQKVSEWNKWDDAGGLGGIKSSGKERNQTAGVVSVVGGRARAVCVVSSRASLNSGSGRRHAL